MHSPGVRSVLRGVWSTSTRRTTVQSQRICASHGQRSLTSTSRLRLDQESVSQANEAHQLLQVTASTNEANLSTTQSKAGRFSTEGIDDHDTPLLKRIRIVPDSPSYFSARPRFTDAYLRVEEHYLRWKTLPRVENAPQILWHDFSSFKAQTGNEPISETRYKTLIKMLRDLSAIEPVLMPPSVVQLLNGFKRAYQPALIKPKEFAVDEWGRSLGVGKRKTSTAKAYLVMGDGQVLINGKNLTTYFARIHDRESALWSLKITNRLDKYNVFAVVGGGGATGQAEALTLAVARALLVHEPTLSQRLLEAGCMYRDPRVVERKKPGHLKARKMPAWVKR